MSYDIYDELPAHDTGLPPGTSEAEISGYRGRARRDPAFEEMDHDDPVESPSTPSEAEIQEDEQKNGAAKEYVE